LVQGYFTTIFVFKMIHY